MNAMDLGEDTIVAKITSSYGRHKVSITQSDLAFGRLKRDPGYIDCSSIFDAEKKLAIKVVGRLTEEAMFKVKGN